MVGGSRRCARWVAPWVLGVVVAGCTVDVTEQDILRQVWTCDADGDCAPGWVCRAFAMDPAEQPYCVQPCLSDADCSFGDFCANEGFCMQGCDVGAPDCRGEGFHCLRTNMMAGQTAGHCQPAVTCESYEDCGQDFDWCLAEIVAGIQPDLAIEPDGSACMESCLGENPCREGFICLKKSLSVFAGINTELVPEVCVPKCGQDNACPNGYRCLSDALLELDPDGEFNAADFKFCVPGMPGVPLPCAGDLQCLSGLCVQDPDSLAIYGVSHSYCVEPCDGQGLCTSAKLECSPSEHDGVPGEFCFMRELLQPCQSSADCELPEVCMDWTNLNSGKACALPCDGWRSEICGGSFTCVPSASGVDFGCYPGMPGMPCFDDDQCHQLYGQQTRCIGTAGLATDADRTCTKTCTHYSQCTFGELGATGAPLCHQGICQPIAFSCDDLTMPYVCNGSMQCAQLYQMGRVCTIPCPGLRELGHDCPDRFTCAPLPQSGGQNVEYFCYYGLPGLMPCRADSECVDIAGDDSQRCLSATGASPEVDGTCTLPCRADSDCEGLFPAGAMADLFCLPGAPDPGAEVPGYCFMNKPLDAFLGEAPGQQGTFCQLGDETCAVDHECVDAAGARAGIMDVLGKRFCARQCQSRADCPQDPVPHGCPDTGVGSNNFCLADRQQAYGRGFWEACWDHRQCQNGVCYQPDPAADVPGNCTRTCSIADPCAASEGENNGEENSLCAAGVCQPIGDIQPSAF